MFSKVDLLKVHDIMPANFKVFTPSAKFQEVLEAFLTLRIDLAPVVDENDRLIGIINKFWLYQSFLSNFSLADSIEKIYINTPRYIHCEKSTTELWQYLDQHQVGQVIIVNNGDYPVGIVTRETMWSEH